MNDYRPVALTSVIMKCFERLVLRYIKSILPKSLDPYQFAYRANRSVEDAVSFVLHTVLAHLDNRNSYARILFIDFSSAFNTISPSKLVTKLSDLEIDISLRKWILSFLYNRPQVVKIGNCISSPIVLNRGAPQGCVLSPLLYSLFTYDCTDMFEGNVIAKFADDTSAVGLISNNDESNYRKEIVKLVDWCDTNELELNVSKTKELIIDFRKANHPIIPIVIKGSEVEIVSVFKYLGIQLSNVLSWQTNTESLIKKAQQRLYFLRRLKKFGMSRTILINFYRTTIESILSYAITVWFGNITGAELYSLVKVLSSAEKIIGSDLPSLQSIYQSRIIKKSKSIIDDNYHPANKYFQLLPSGRRYRCIRTKSERFRKSSYPSSIRILNQM